MRPGTKASSSKPGLATDNITGSPQAGSRSTNRCRRAVTRRFGLTGIPPDEAPAGAVQAVVPEPLQGGIVGVVWRTRPGGGTPGEVESDELGISARPSSFATPAATRSRRR